MPRITQYIDSGPLEVSLEAGVLTSGLDVNIDEPLEVVFEAGILTSGLDVNISNPLKIGETVWAAVGNTEVRMDATPLVGAGYPMTLELQVSADCRVKQGDSTVVLDPVNNVIYDGDWRVVNVDSATEAYFALMADDPTASGIARATRIDTL